MTEELRKQQYGRAFILALAAQSGMNHTIPENDFGVDGVFRSVSYDPKRKRYYDDGCTIDYQLKSTVDVQLVDGAIKYDLEAKNYQDLILNRMMPMILVLYIMPRKEEEWFSVNEEESILKRGAWWCSLRGEPEKLNSSTVRISIPVNQLLTPDALTELMNKVRKGEAL